MPEIKIVNDQVGSPTYAGWLADITVKFIPKFKPGLYHAANEGEVSWFDFAKRIVELTKSKCRVLPQSTEELNRPAPRPPYSVLNSNKVMTLIGENCQSWDDGLKQHLLKLSLA